MSPAGRRTVRETVTVIVVVFLLGSLWGCMPPDDSVLVGRFNENRRDFEQIVKMSNEDSHLVRIAPRFTRLDTDWSWPRPQSKWGLTPQRWDEYRRLFQKTGLRDGLYSFHGGKQLFLVAYAGGMMGRGESAGYTFCGESMTEASPDSLPPCLNHDESFAGDKYRYRKIVDGWYIFEEY